MSLEEALKLSKKIGKTMYLNDKLKSGDKINKLMEIENYLFKDQKNLVVIDMNARVLGLRKSNVKNDVIDSNKSKF